VQNSKPGREHMTKLKNLSVDLEIGQTILVGPKREPAQITKIEYHPKSGDVMINTTRGPRRALTFSIPENVQDSYENPADRYR